MRLKIPPGVRGIARKWTIKLIIRTSVRGIVSKWTIILIIRSGVREIKSKTVNLIIWRFQHHLAQPRQLSIKGLLSATAISSDILLEIKFDNEWNIRLIIRSDVRRITS
jgi:hypothetical protein